MLKYKQGKIIYDGVIMNKEYCSQLHYKMMDFFAKSKLEITRRINECENVTSLDKKYLIEKVRTFSMDMNADDFKWIILGIYNLNHPKEPIFFLKDQILYELGFTLLQKIQGYFYNISLIQDSDPVEIEGDIVITDPCYTTDKWLDEGFDLDSLPLCRDTMYGDWSCTTFNTVTNEVIGEFCADAGMVCVDTLENIKKRKPNFEEDLCEWCRTIIKDFKGTVKFEIVCLKDNDDILEFSLWDYEVRVVGDGVNTKTGEMLCQES